MAFGIYFINLDSSVDRRRQIENELQKVGIEDFSRIAGLDGRQINLDIAGDYNETAAYKLMGRALIGAEYGCYKSHLACLKRAVDTSKGIAIVLEDDAVIEPNFSAAVKKIIQKLSEFDPEWDLVHIGANRLKIFSQVSRININNQLVAAHYFPMNTCGLVWSYRGAIKFIQKHSEIKMPIDHQIRELMVRNGNGYAIWPPLVKQRHVQSDVDNPNDDRKMHRRRWHYGISKHRRLIFNRIIATFRQLIFNCLSHRRIRRSRSLEDHKRA